MASVEKKSAKSHSVASSLTMENKFCECQNLFKFSLVEARVTPNYSAITPVFFDIATLGCIFSPLFMEYINSNSKLTQ